MNRRTYAEIALGAYGCVEAANVLIVKARASGMTPEALTILVHERWLEIVAAEQGRPPPRRPRRGREGRA